jgi:hypothetical protein
MKSLVRAEDPEARVLNQCVDRQKSAVVRQKPGGLWIARYRQADRYLSFDGIDSQHKSYNLKIRAMDHNHD